MKKGLTGIFLIFLALTLAACGPKAQEFKSDAGKFSVMTPLTLKETSQTLDTKQGKIEFHQFAAEDDTRSYLVGYSDYPPEDLNADAGIILDGARDAAAQALGAVVTANAAIDLDGNPGIEFIMSTKVGGSHDATAKAHLFLVDGRMYQVMALGVDGQLSLSDMDTFLQSFKLLQ